MTETLVGLADFLRRRHARGAFVEDPLLFELCAAAPVPGDKDVHGPAIIHLPAAQVPERLAA